MSNKAEPKVEVKKFGHEKEPIVIIDNFSSHFDSLKNDAFSVKFLSAAAGYPGIRSQRNPQYLSEHGGLLGDVAKHVFGFQLGMSFESLDYSIVTIAPQDLDVRQRIPHYDDTSSSVLALMHYMLPQESGGTAFYRHKATGFESITPQRSNEYAASLALELQNDANHNIGYIYGSNDQFEMIGEIESLPNRLILYRGRMLHSGCIAKDATLSPDPSIGRLTINGFLTETESG